MQRTLFSMLLLSVFTLCVSAQTSILPGDIYNLSGNVGAGATAEAITVNGQAFTQGYRLTVPGTSSSISDAQIGWTNTQAVTANDNLQLTFWVRKVAPLDHHNIRGFVSFETATSKLLFTSFPCDREAWTKYVIPFKATSNLAVSEARLSFQFAFGPQTFELGGISLVNLGPTPPPPATGASVIPNNYFSYFDNAVGGGSATSVAATGPGFTQAIQITTNGTSNFIYNAGLGWNTNAQINKDDVLLLTFWARRLESTTSHIRAHVLFEKASADFNKSVTVGIPVDTSEWQQFQVAFKSIDNYAPGQAHLVFQFAYGPQKFEIGGVRLLNFGPNVALNQFQPFSYYPQRGNANAPWRAEANTRINQIRKGDLKVNVVDRSGKPIEGATVYVQQLNHAYKFGSAVTAALLTGTSADAEIYRSRVSSHFTTTVLENDLKWGLWECTGCTNFQKPNTRTAIQWLLDRGITARGHNLIWPGWNHMPSGLQSLSPTDLQNRITARFQDVLNDAGVKGKLYQWDVLNEPYTNYDVQGRIAGVPNVAASNGVLGNQEMVRWFQLARQLDPNTKLFINDYDILAAGGANVNQQNYYFAVINWLLDNGAPVDGAGMQGHFGGATPIDRMQEIIARFSTLRVPLAITEYDFNSTDESLQADFTRDFLTLIFSSAKFDDFLMWGFWERAHWLPAGAMYRADWSSKPNALVWNDLWFREWWTNESGASDSSGVYRARGFKGDYNVTVNFARVAKTATVKLEATGEVTITLDVDAKPRN
ncbi:MAG TPA: endo-1,4-beta-xylanase, partial [Blastocatellia bacterium]|nr:endo-1,4-beta-xylanase [Blastocatellia bacterium]